MYELASTLVELCRREEDQTPDIVGPRLLVRTSSFLCMEVTSALMMLQEAARLYTRSLWHLQWQPECQPERRVAEQAHLKMHAIQNQLRLLHPSSH